MREENVVIAREDTRISRTNTEKQILIQFFQKALTDLLEIQEIINERESNYLNENPSHFIETSKTFLREWQEQLGQPLAEITDFFHGTKNNKVGLAIVNAISQIFQNQKQTLENCVANLIGTNQQTTTKQIRVDLPNVMSTSFTAKPKVDMSFLQQSITPVWRNEQIGLDHMYHDFYELKGSPFNVTADPELFYASKNHSDAITNLMYGIEQRKGLLVITGEVGTGKTTLCRKLIKQANKNTKFAFILNPNFSEVELLQMILHDLGIRCRDQNKVALITSLNKFLMKESKKGRNVVLVIDEAQNLSITQLEQIRLLSNLETEKEKLLQIILVGQPELYQSIQLPALRQLRQRVSVYFRIEALDKSDLREYIQHRIKKMMRNPESIRHIMFTDGAIDSIYHFSKGSPRSINILCDRALLAGFTVETYSIDENIINECAKEVLYCEHNL